MSVVCVLSAKATHQADKLDNLAQKRHLRSHKKSRTGCRNCKARRVKCDEFKPGCKRCQSYGVLCDYSSNELLEPDLMVPSDGLASTGVIRLRQCSPITAMLGMVNHVMADYSDSSVGGFGNFKMDADDLNRLERFQTRTVISIGTKVTGEVYQQQVIKLVCQHPYLMHTVMALTCMHDRYLSKDPHHRSLNESYHYGQAASLFRKKLSQVVNESDHDALWATCALLGSMSIFAMDAADPEEAWPLKRSKSDLEWLEVLDGIHAVWAIIKPTRRGSAFENLANDRSKAQLLATKTPTSYTGMEILPPALLDLCEVRTSSSVADNSYFAALHNLAPLINMPCNQHTFLCFLAFTGHMDTTYKQLLHVKDPRALLILAYWYAKLCQGAPWFLISRALIECKAICLYLDRFHANDKALQDLLHFPKSQSGLSTSDTLPLTPVSMSG